ncbi:MAG: adenylyltransferase/cytidyltransferase family protein [Promethearchaeota archaeon]|jgi:FAD synthetase
MNEIKKRVLIAGCFDLLHAGHIYLVNEAAKLGEVFVVVATDKNREMFSGERPIISQEQRLEIIKSIKNVKGARIGRSDNNTLKTVQEINPDIILLGPDQRYSIELLKKGLKEKGLSHIELKRLKTYFDKYELHSSSSIKKKIIDRFRENN